jgi:hypothetical protein
MMYKALHEQRIKNNTALVIHEKTNPTMAAMANMEQFPAFIKKLEKEHKAHKIGIIKIIPPSDWSRRTGGYGPENSPNLSAKNSFSTTPTQCCRRRSPCHSLRYRSSGRAVDLLRAADLRRARHIGYARVLWVRRVAIPGMQLITLVISTE